MSVSYPEQDTPGWVILTGAGWSSGEEVAVPVDHIVGFDAEGTGTMWGSYTVVLSSPPPVEGQAPAGPTRIPVAQSVRQILADITARTP